MSNPTTPFSWQMPTATDLVTDLPADFEVFGQAVATSMADLLGGTSGQILAKNSNTDMDFVWIANDQGDITGITATSPLTGGGSSGAVTVGIQDGTTAQKGAVQLENSTSSTSTTTAAVPASVKSAYDLADGAIAKSTVTTAGDIIYRNATVPTRLGIGTAGQVLTVNSGATAPEWATAPSGGGMTLIGSGTLSGSQVNITSISGSYIDLALYILNFDPSANNNSVFMRFNNDSANRYYVGGAVTGGSFNVSRIELCLGASNTSNEGLISVDIPNYANTTTWKYAGAINLVNNATTTTTVNFDPRNGIYNQTGAITEINLLPSSGTFAGGTYALYGVK